MARLWRLFVVVIVLTFAVPMHVAWASCAWVMWRTTIPWHAGRGYIEKDRTWVLLYTYDTRRTCEDRANQQAMAQAALPGWHLTADNAASRNQTFQGGVEGMTTEAYRCYPDTIDPCGPGGKR